MPSCRDAARDKLLVYSVKNILSLRDDEFIQTNPSSTYRGKDLAQQQIQGGRVETTASSHKTPQSFHPPIYQKDEAAFLNIILTM